MKKVFLIIFKIFRAIWESSFFLAAAVFIFLVAYILGGKIFLEGNFMGNDVPNALTFINFYDQWWPKIPQWFPWQGGGIHIGIFYYEWSHFMVVIIHRLSSLSITEVLNLLSFLTVPITSIGVFLFVWKSFKNQAVALVAAVLYMFSPVAWYSLTHGGFFAQQVGYCFVPYMFLFADSYWENQRLKKKNLTVFFLVLFAITGFFQAFSHMVVFIVTMVGVALYLCFWALFLPQPGGRLKSYFREIKMIILLLVTCGLVCALPLLELKNALKVTGREGLVNPAPHDIPFLTIKTLFGMVDEGLSEANWIDVNSLYSFSFFPVYIGILFGIGLLMTAIRRSKAFAMALVSLMLLLYSTIPYYLPQISKYLAFLLSYGVRMVAVPVILVPVVGAFGLYLVGETLIFFPFWLVDKLTHLKLGFLKPLGVILASLLLLGVAPLYLIKTIPLQNNRTPLGENFRGYGPFGSSGFKEVSSLEEVKALFPEKLEVKELKMEIADTGGDYIKKLGLGQFDRIDISPYLGQLSAGINFRADVPQASLYGYGFSLNHSIWGYSQGIFFHKDFGNANSMNQLAQWFGTKYYFLHPGHDPIDQYQNNDWEEIEPMRAEMSVYEDKVYARVFKNLKNPQLATWTSRPAVLVIGKFKNRPYEQFFRVAIHGALDIDDAIFVEGIESGKVDQYSLAELKQFDLLVLSAYDFRFKASGREKLRKYIESGGNIFIDTGWQYVVPDWESEITPAYLPVENLVWQKIGQDWQGASLTGLGGNYELDKFGKLVWGDDQWSVSTTTTNMLRNWAEPVLVKDNQVIMARGQLGKGRVFWSGMNLISHIMSNDFNQEEMRLFNSALKWLLEEKQKEDYLGLTLFRDYPDQLKISLNQTVSKPSILYWREAFSPRLRVKLHKNDGSQVSLKPYRAGTGMVLLFLPKVSSGDKILFKFAWPLAMKIGALISILSLLLLLLIVIDTWFFDSSFLKKIPIIKKQKSSSVNSPNKFKKWWNSEES